MISVLDRGRGCGPTVWPPPSIKLNPLVVLKILVWDKALTYKPDESRSASALVRCYLNMGHKKLDLGEGLAVAEHLVGSLCPKLFATFFSQLQLCIKKKWGLYLKRRVVIRTPSHGDTVSRVARSLFVSLLTTCPCPQHF